MSSPPSQAAPSTHDDSGEPGGPVHGEPPLDAVETPADRDAGETESSGETGLRSELTLEDMAAKAARRRLSARDEALALELTRKTLLTGRPGVLRVLALAGSLPWVVLVNASASAWPGLKPTARAQFLKGIGTVPGEGFVRTRMSIIRGLWKADAGAASKAISMLFQDFVDKDTGLLPAREAIQFGNVFLGRGRPWIASADISSLKAAEQDTVRLGIFSACVQTPQAPPVIIYAMRVIVDARLVDKLTPQQLECGERSITKLSTKWQRSLLQDVPELPEIFRTRVHIRPETMAQGDSSDVEDRPAAGGDDEEPVDIAAGDAQPEASAGMTTSADADHSELRRERPVYISKTIPSKADTRQEERRNEERRAEEREARDDRSRRGREPQPEPRRATGPFNPADALRQLDAYIQGLRVELNAAQVRLRQRDDDARRKRPERRSSTVPGDLSAEELYRQVRQLELRNAELQAQIEDFRASSEVRGVSRGLVDGLIPDDAATELRRALTVTLRDDFEDFEALKRDAKDVVVQRYFGSLLQHIFEALRDEGVIFEGLTPGIETKDQIIESQAALKAVDIVPLVLDEPDDEDLEELDVLDAKAEDLEQIVSDLDVHDGEDHTEAAVDEEHEEHGDANESAFGEGTEDSGLADDHRLSFAESRSDEPMDECAFPDVSREPRDDGFSSHTDDTPSDSPANHALEHSSDADFGGFDKEPEQVQDAVDAAPSESSAEVSTATSELVSTSPAPKRNRASKSRTPEAEA